MRQKASLNQARVKRVLAVGLQNHLQNSTVMYDHQGSYYFQCHHMEVLFQNLESPND